MSQLVDRIQEGGPVFMIPLVLIIIAIVVLFIIALLGKKKILHVYQLIGHLSLFGMIWGFLGSTLGLISAFDAIESIGNVSQPMFAGGIKVALLTTVFGLITFLIGRIAMLVLTIKSQMSTSVDAS
ncbi:MotA/TolQ/ExbB proton channel family protein [uncultured Dokdonia sp.]|uniref:MotA/TolQ/ExbB proton channel family protein n=1 Tax=uncultured Dokdonia sp. TaxID=575653 RepID=UPI00260DDF56|nr:MotA/TolQ/ExbB proton channel family protein [uncultured Dokdonia sp.]